MALTSLTEKNSCAKCIKGVGITTCNGCQQSFCLKHFNEHREELSNRIEEIIQERDFLRQNFEQNNFDDCLLYQINKWEQQSIAKIRMIAEQARADLHEVFNKNTTILKTMLSEITNELQSSRESNDYTEIDLNKWMKQLEQFRKKIEGSSIIYIDKNKSPESVIHLIKVHDQTQQDLSTNISTSSYQPSPVVNQSNFISKERFGEISGKGVIESGNLVVKSFTDSIFSSPTAYGINRYSSDIHRIRFRINQINQMEIFLGIVSETNAINRICNKSKYGWWCQAEVSDDDTKEYAKDYDIVRIGDEITLILNCNHQQIQLEHHRTNLVRQLSVDINLCPYPWKIIVILESYGDSVRILS